MRQTVEAINEIIEVIGELMDEETTHVGNIARLTGDITQIKVKFLLIETDLRDCIDELCNKCSDTEPATKCKECRWHRIREEM